ncbi:MBL fold metallo-hydrolase [Halieaceae bacterium IMCC14734]|uniref:MBL fold metallo-hydrolase n=1 Tax=Candidatus Litorirhabdus singularis TaxID=2518993 RepID=A0ABT3TFR3_9GAMM|nr:MBL fold metallo-hydrolase [Candidatus Litorirhabdus singularis]MCX2980660.1 MBL fold metallo-hydrolase [Candidatus Litorirhabdus singularis]
MIFHQIATERGCQSYFLACEETCMAVVIDPEETLLDRYLGLAAQEGVRLHYVLDTHTHADHFSGGKELAQRLRIPLIMHRNSPAPFVDMRVDDGEKINLGKLSLNLIHTPGHTADSLCVLVKDRVFTGDTLLIGGCGRSDLPTGDADQLFDSLFNKLLLLDPATRVYPAHIYSDRDYSTLAEEAEHNPRLQLKQRDDFVQQMRTLTLREPDHLSEALRTNLTGGKTVEQLIAEAAHSVSFMSLEEVLRRTNTDDPEIILLDVREREEFAAGHIAGAIHIPRGQLELRVNQALQDPTLRIVVYCEYGRISTLATATLRDMGFTRAVAMDQGLQLWREKNYPLTEK